MWLILQWKRPYSAMRIRPFLYNKRRVTPDADPPSIVECSKVIAS